MHGAPCDNGRVEDLVSFIAARLDEDEAAAKRVNGQWQQDAPGTGVILIDGEPLIEGHIGGLVEHIARHDPARVLREVEAKRAILAACAETLQGEDSHDYVTEGGTGEEYELAHFVLRQLAAVYRPEREP